MTMSNEQKIVVSKRFCLFQGTVPPFKWRETEEIHEQFRMLDISVEIQTGYLEYKSRYHSFFAAVY
jgi:hypothetical protein